MRDPVTDPLNEKDIKIARDTLRLHPAGFEGDRMFLLDLITELRARVAELEASTATLHSQMIFGGTPTRHSGTLDRLELLEALR